MKLFVYMSPENTKTERPFFLRVIILHFSDRFAYVRECLLRVRLFLYFYLTFDDACAISGADRTNQQQQQKIKTKKSMNL